MPLQLSSLWTTLDPCKDTQAGKKTDASFVTRGDIERIKKSTKIETTQDVRAN